MVEGSADLTIEQKILSIIAEISGVTEVLTNLDLRLYDLDLMDSFMTVELIVAFSEKFGVEVSPAEFDREQWGTPAMIVSNVKSRLAARQSA